MKYHIFEEIYSLLNKFGRSKLAASIKESLNEWKTLLTAHKKLATKYDLVSSILAAKRTDSDAMEIFNNLWLFLNE